MTSGASRLVLHLGVPKTGSSALQVAFVRNRERLEELGVLYPAGHTDARARQGRVMAGNGVQLLPFLVGRPVAQLDAQGSFQRVRDTVEGAAVPDVLYSSETLFGFLPDRLGELAADLTGRGVRAHAVLFVRDLAGHAWSAYSQHLKRQQYTGTFSEFVAADRPYNPQWRPQLERLVGTLGRANVQVMHYDSCRSQLVEVFMREVFGIEDLSGFDLSAGQVNRSLTRREMNFVRYINQRSDGRPGSTQLDDVLQRRTPLGDPEVSVSPAELAVLEERFGDQVAWVNDEFFPDRRLRIAPESLAYEPGADHELTENERYLLDCLVDLGNPGPQPLPDESRVQVKPH